MNPDATFTSPINFTNRSTRSRSPSADLIIFQMIESAAACHLVTLFQRYLIANFANVSMGLTVKYSGVTTNEQQMTDLNEGDVMGSGLWRGWQLLCKRW